MTPKQSLICCCSWISLTTWECYWTPWSPGQEWPLANHWCFMIVIKRGCNLHHISMPCLPFWHPTSRSSFSCLVLAVIVKDGQNIWALSSTYSASSRAHNTNPIHYLWRTKKLNYGRIPLRIIWQRCTILVSHSRPLLLSPGRLEGRLACPLLLSYAVVTITTWHHQVYF